ncbi:MAG: hypothetical protein IPI80_07950 [Burkholderiales bacterium]|nr:hypothetical protein [Burkholderiales bacterium]MBK7313684.1 hypothetical protein [Burkholderiales bacterium]
MCGFQLGATSGRTTLGSEGRFLLRHADERELRPAGFAS